MSAAESYPPKHHVLRDLAMRVVREDDRPILSMPIAPALLAEAGGLRAGVAAMAADIVSGELAVRAAQPGWVATSSLSLQLERLPDDGTLDVHPSLIRRGRTTIVLESRFRHVESDRELGLATTTFAVLPARSELQRADRWSERPEPVIRLGGDSGGLDRPLDEAIGLAADPGDPSSIRLPLTDYVRNTLGAMQGGVVAILLESAALRGGAVRLGHRVRARSLEVHYLNLAKVGPVRAEARPLAALTDGALMRVELHDEGRDDALLSIGTVLVERA